MSTGEGCEVVRGLGSQIATRTRDDSLDVRRANSKAPCNGRPRVASDKGSVDLAPLFQRDLGVSSIVCLLFLGRPTTIPRLVVSIVVDAVKRPTRPRFATHVGKEHRKGTPVRRYANTASAIVPIGRRSPVQASASHACPASVLGGLPFSVRASRTHQSSLQATTAAGAAAKQAGTPYERLGAAFTSAPPCRFVMPSPLSSYHCQQTEGHTGHINWETHIPVVHRLTDRGQR